MIFNVEQTEYVPDFTTVAGVRVLVHDQKRTPFLRKTESIFLLDFQHQLASEWQVSSNLLRSCLSSIVCTIVDVENILNENIPFQTQISRLDGQFGNCTKLTEDHSNSNVYEAVFPWHNYTLKVS